MLMEAVLGQPLRSPVRATPTGAAVPPILSTSTNSKKHLHDQSHSATDFGWITEAYFYWYETGNLRGRVTQICKMK
jgi:hypothetical protein